MTYLDLPTSLGLLAFDLLLMAGAVVFLALGFTRSSQGLRNTGLAITFCTVAKILAIDTWEFDPLTKAIACIVGGAVCLVLGALYSRAAKGIDAVA